MCTLQVVNFAADAQQVDIELLGLHSSPEMMKVIVLNSTDGLSENSFEEPYLVSLLSCQLPKMLTICISDLLFKQLAMLVSPEVTRVDQRLLGSNIFTMGGRIFKIHDCCIMIPFYSKTPTASLCWMSKCMSLVTVLRHFELQLLRFSQLHCPSIFQLQVSVLGGWQ